MARDRLPRTAGSESVEVIGPSVSLWSWHSWHTRQDFENHANLNNILGLIRAGEIIGTVVYSHHRHSDIEIGIHTIDPAWCNRRTLKAIFSYPFVELGLNRVTATTDPANPAVCNFLKRIGFVEEGRLRQCKPDGGDILLLGMTRQECRWI